MESTTQIYLEITPDDSELAGESRAGGYEQRIDIDSFSLSFKAKPDTVKGVQKQEVVGNFDFGRLKVVKKFDRVSLPLAGLLRQHEKIKEARISVDQQYVEGGETKMRNEVLILCFYSGYIADIQLRTSEGKAGATAIVENIELSFHNFSVDYYGYSGSYEGGDGQQQLGDDYRLQNASFQTNRPEQPG
jgi:type VI protein secretion system component Hcp